MYLCVRLETKLKNEFPIPRIQIIGNQIRGSGFITRTLTSVTVVTCTDVTSGVNVSKHHSKTEQNSDIEDGWQKFGNDVKSDKRETSLLT
jgi:hypothetical protein